MSKIVAIVQARMGSSRLPGKVMQGIMGKTMLWHIVNRIQNSGLIDEIIIATTSDKKDNEIADFAIKNNFNIFRGSEDDVLDRYYQTAKKYKADIIVRITGDCPLADPVLVDEVIQFYLDNDFDYASNTIKPTYPDGLDTEIFSFNVLEQAWEEADLQSEREHVTPYIKKHSEIFKLGNFENSTDLSHMRWCVDCDNDLVFIKEVFQRLYKKKQLFLMKEVLDLLKENPEFNEINRRNKRDERYFHSLKYDKKIKKVGEKNVGNKNN